MGRGSGNEHSQAQLRDAQEQAPAMTLKGLRQHEDEARRLMQKKGTTAVASLDKSLTLDREYRQCLQAHEQLVAEKRVLSEQVALAKRQGEDPSDLYPQLKQLSQQEKAAQQQMVTVKEKLDYEFQRVPNLPETDAPTSNVVLRQVGTEDRLETGISHEQLVGHLIDTQAGARLAGSRFAYLRGPLVRTQFALTSLVMDKLEAKGFELIIPPALAREEALYGTGFLPDSEQQLYELPKDDLYLLGTSEVALASMHAQEILEQESLPLRYAAQSSCFRREAGAAGKDTQGLIRLHQFDKLEMFSIVTPEQSQAEHQRILSVEEEILSDLGIPYQVVDIAADDLGSSAARKYDCEAWFPAQGTYREVTSCSNTTDFQAQRLQIRQRPQSGKSSKTKPQPVHMLNGTACALGRTIAALLENHQRADGSVVLPDSVVEHGAPRVINKNS